MSLLHKANIVNPVYKSFVPVCGEENQFCGVLNLRCISLRVILVRSIRHNNTESKVGMTLVNLGEIPKNLIESASRCVGYCLRKRIPARIAMSLSACLLPDVIAE